MAVDPSISLGITQPPNPITIAGQLASGQTAIQGYLARQRAGAIIAASPDLETAFNSLTQDPTVAPFAGSIINEYRQGMLAQTQRAGELQKQFTEGYGALVKGIVGGGGQPSMIGPIAQSILQGLSPQIREAVTSAGGNLITALTQGLPTDPVAAEAAFKQRIAGLGVSTGMSPDQLSSILGTAKVQDIGGQLVPGVQAPAAAGGGFTSAPGTLTKTLPPTVTTGPGSVPIVLGAGGGVSTGGGVVPPNALGGRPVPSSAPVAAAPSIPLAGDGKPLWTSTTPMTAPRIGTGVAGLPLLSAAQVDQNKQLSDEYNGAGKKAFDNAQQTLGSLQYMDAGYNNLVRGGGNFLEPGAGADFRGALAKAGNTIQTMLGEKPSFDPEKIATIEDMQKETKRMGLMVTNLMLGQQREAAQTIQNVTASVPGVSNTYLGGKLVLNGIQAAAQRVIDERNFINQYQRQNGGTLLGATEAFNDEHPPEAYAQGVLSKFGLNEKGFGSPAAVKDAVRQGFLTRAQAIGILHSQFPDQFQAPQ